MTGLSDDQRRRLEAERAGAESTAGPAAADDWLAGSPMDPTAEPPEPLPPLPGFPFLHAGMGAVLVGPTGGGRSSLIQSGLYDAAKAGLRCAYLGHEVIEAEFNARAGKLIKLRDDELSDWLLGELSRVRYLDLTSVIIRAWAAPEDWIVGICASYDIVVIDPLSAVESALGLNFQQGNDEYVLFYDRLVLPATSKGVQITLVDNIGHSVEARDRAKGASAKGDRADLSFSCRSVADGVLIKAKKVRSVRAAFRFGDEWLFDRDSQTVAYRGTSSTASEGDDDGFRPTNLMEKASRVIEGEPGIGANGIKKAIPSRDEFIVQAVRKLIVEKYVECRGQGQTRHHYSLRPYRELDDPGAAPTGAGDGAPPAHDEGGTSGTDSRTDSRLFEASTGSRESPVNTGAGTSSQPVPTNSRNRVANNQGTGSGGRSPRSRDSVGDAESDPFIDEVVRRHEGEQ